MKYFRIRVQYGKNNKFVAREWVAEDAIGQFVIEWTSTVRGWGWKKEINFMQEESFFTAGTAGNILAYTADGRHLVRVD